MLPSEVRARVLDDHAHLREELDRLEGRVRAGVSNDDGARELRDMGEQILEHLAAHMRWEDVNLAPALKEADAWGDERESRMAIEHRNQRRALRELLERIRNPERAADAVARDLLEFVHWLREDMDGEERTLLDPKVLRDDVVAVDASSG